MSVSTDPAGTNRVVRTMTFLCINLGIVACILTVLLLPVSTSWFGLQLEPALVQFVFVASAIGFVANTFLQNLLAIFKAIHRYDISMRLAITTETAKIGGILLVLKMGLGLRAMCVAFVGGIALGVLASWLSIRRRLPWAQLMPVYDPQTIRLLLGYGVFSLALGASNIGRANVGNILIAKFGSASAVPYFAIPYQAASQIMGIIASLTTVFFPVFSSLQAAGNKNLIEKVFVSATKYTTLCGVAIGVPVLIFCRDALRLWMGHDFAVEAGDAFQVLTLIFAAVIPATAAHYYLNGIGRIGMTATLAIGSLIVIAALGFILIPKYGILGAAGCYAGNLILLHQIYSAGRDIWGERALNKIVEMLKPVVLSGLIVTTIFSFLIGSSLQSWSALLLYTFLALLGIVVCTVSLDARFHWPHLLSLWRSLKGDSGDVKTG